MDKVALAALGATILLAWRFKLNPGAVAIGFALLLGRMAHLSDKAVLSYWPTSLTYMLLSVTYLYGFASVNGTLTGMANWAVGKVYRTKPMVPVVFFLLCFVIAAVGPGGLTVFALMTPIAMETAAAFGFHPLVMAISVLAGGAAGHLSPIAVGGLVGLGLMGPQQAGLAGPVWSVTAAVESTFFIGAYIWLKGWKSGLGDAPDRLSAGAPGFSRKQKITMAILALVFLLSIVFKIDVTMTSFVGVALCAAFKVADTSPAKMIPIETIITICGMGVLVALGDKLGSTVLISEAARGVSGGHPDVALGLVAGVMSTVSSTTGVVMPVLYPTVARMVVDPGFPKHLLYGAITAGAMATGISPISSAGALILASTSEKTTQRYHLYRSLIGLVFVRLSWSVAVIWVLKTFFI